MERKEVERVCGLLNHYNCVPASAICHMKHFQPSSPFFSCGAVFSVPQKRFPCSRLSAATERKLDAAFWVEVVLWPFKHLFNFKTLPSTTTQFQDQPAAALEGLDISALLKGISLLIVEGGEESKIRDISPTQTGWRFELTTFSAHFSNQIP